ncbi:nuclear transport factor 2 family protein [Flavobacterium azooxidireducens]|uniref:Nuclear transport factor 2 family protein n=1 Tax=Flavobacterium azooxidireducens TaxID=1871076 RepID=A0ABY4KCX3_9FLAO|nr:nuclear transport factor 2 family protein [Flavobacterium azooxidireducens]UPQ78639.1 nuclear transport factor 2 family protein [Flavobacterium azooxidireducens]
MKNSIIILVLLFSIISCQKTETRYTQQSPEIDSFKKSIEAYEKADWATMKSFYADSAKIEHNVTKDKAVSVDKLIEISKEDATLFSNIDFIDSESEYEMVVTDDGETWVNFWGDWKGTLKATGEEYILPCAITAQFVNGKIVREVGFWNTAKIALDLQKLSAASTVVDSTTTR